MGSRSGLSAIYIIVGLSALLVSINRAIPGPLEREASIRLGSTFFLYMYVSSSSIFVFTVVAKWLLNVYVIMEKMYAYEAPVVEIIEVEVEKGFAGSLPDYTPNPF